MSIYIKNMELKQIILYKNQRGYFFASQDQIISLEATRIGTYHSLNSGIFVYLIRKEAIEQNLTTISDLERKLRAKIKIKDDIPLRNGGSHLTFTPGAGSRLNYKEKADANRVLEEYLVTNHRQ